MNVSGKIRFKILSARADYVFPRRGPKNLRSATLHRPRQYRPAGGSRRLSESIIVSDSERLAMYAASSASVAKSDVHRSCDSR